MPRRKSKSIKEEIEKLNRLEEKIEEALSGKKKKHRFIRSDLIVLILILIPVFLYSPIAGFIIMLFILRSCVKCPL